MKYLITSGCSFTRQQFRCNTEGNCFDFENDFIEMFLHHVVAISLVAGCYAMN